MPDICPWLNPETVFSPWLLRLQKCVAVSYQMKLQMKQWDKEKKNSTHISLLSLIQLSTTWDQAVIAFLNMMLLSMALATVIIILSASLKFILKIWHWIFIAPLLLPLTDDKCQVEQVPLYQTKRFHLIMWDKCIYLMHSTLRQCGPRRRTAELQPQQYILSVRLRHSISIFHWCPKADYRGFAIQRVSFE